MMRLHTCNPSIYYYCIIFSSLREISIFFDFFDNPSYFVALRIHLIELYQKISIFLSLTLVFI